MDGVTSTDRPLQLAVGEGAARLVLNRPNAGNRFTTELLDELVAALDAVANAAPVVLVIEGRGDDFCLGRDASGDASIEAAERSLRRVVEVGARLRDLSSLVLASLRGRALGFGAGLVMHSDLAVASRGAKLAFDEVQRGFPPTIVMSYLEGYLPRKVARELVCTGREIGAEEAGQLGVVNRVVDEDRLSDATDQFVDGLLGVDRAALASCKPFLVELGGVPPERREEHAIRELLTFLDERRHRPGGAGERE